jgi:hypothetical protein
MSDGRNPADTAYQCALVHTYILPAIRNEVQDIPQFVIDEEPSRQSRELHRALR